jgi:hypothetical protein
MKNVRFATYSSSGETFYGAVTETGMISLSGEFPQWPNLKAVIEAGSLNELARAATDKPVTHTEFDYQIPLCNPEKII